MTTLKKYLATLNSSETQWGIWVNPKDLNDYRIGQRHVENGGCDDEKVFIGNLESLSFGFQSVGEALEILLFNDGISYRGVTFTKDNCNIEGFKEAFYMKKLHPPLQEIINLLIEELHQEWAEGEADIKIMELEDYFATDGEYWQELALL
jgi:hypothetical protein